MLEYQINPSPMRQEEIRAQQFDYLNSVTYGRKIYATTFKPDSFDSIAAGVFDDLLLESATDHLLQEDTSIVYLEESSSTKNSIVYLFSGQQSIYLAGSAEGKSSGSDLVDLSVVFKPGFFKAGDVLVFEANGKITANATNNSLKFTITFPDTGTEATVSMPSTITQDTLAEWKLVVNSSFGHDSSGNGTVSHSGRLTVINSTDARGESQHLMSTVLNTFDYNTTLYYKPQVEWLTTTATSTVDFYTAYMTVT